MKKRNELLSLFLVIVMLTGMFPAAAAGSDDAPEMPDLPQVEGLRRPEDVTAEVPKVLPERPEDSGRQLELTETVRGTCGGNLTWVLTTDGTLTISGEGEMDSSLPWDDYSRYITKVVIEDGVTGIGDYAFRDCDSLESVTIGDGVITLGDSVFEYCNSLSSVTLGKCVTDINTAFSWCSSLKSIVLPDSITSIDMWAFENCSNLESVVIGNGVTNIDGHAFRACESLASITFGDSVATIGDFAFSGCEALTSIGRNAFGYCYSLKSVDLPDGLTVINYGLFDYCTALESVTIPEGVTMIDWYGFAGCKSLTEITLPVGLTTIEYNAFDWCENLTTIVIPVTVTMIGNTAFYWCNALTTVCYGGTKSQWEKIEIGNGNDSLLEAEFVWSYVPPSTTPVVTGGTNDAGKPKLTWDAVEGAEKYEIWRATSKNGTYSKWYTTGKTSYTNTGAEPGTSYYYKVRAVKGDTYSEFSDVKSICCDCARPVVTVGVNSKGKPKLTWDAVEGAEKYEIWRATSKNGTYTRQYTTTGTSYTNTSAEAGQTYYYKVKAICGKSSYGNSAFSEIVSVTSK